MPSWEQEMDNVYRQLKPGLVKREARLEAKRREKERIGRARGTRTIEIEGRRTRVHWVSLEQQREAGYDV